MLEAYTVGLVVCFTFGAVAIIVSATMALITQEKEFARAAALVFVASIVLPWVWPIVVVVGVVFAVCYSIFTTARVIRHRSLDF